VSGFKVVSERSAEVTPIAPSVDEARLAAAKAQEAHQQAARYLVTALQVVSQRFVTAIALAWHTSFTAALALSVWRLWSVVLVSPDAPKLAGATLYSLFALAVEFLRRKS
jgi:hypothetical protein